MARAELTADTSVIVPSLVAWHSLHAPAVAAIANVGRLPAHALSEAFSVLTRMPPPRSVSPAVAWALLNRSFPRPPLVLPGASLQGVLARLAGVDIGGGRVYDAVVAATAQAAGVTLLTADRRALPTYQIVGVRYEFIR